MRQQNVSVLREDIITRLRTNNDYSVLEIIGKLLNLSESKQEKKVVAMEFVSMTAEEIVEQALRAEEEIKQGKTISHKQAYQQFKKWK